VNSQPSALDEALYRCNKCGFCQATCAFYQDTREERAVARGRLRLIKGQREGQIGLSDVYAERIFECFMCGGCSVSCPSGVEIEALLLDARRELARSEMLPAPLMDLQRTVTASGTLTGEGGEARLSWTQNLSFAPPVGGHHDVVYFVGCVSSLYPRAYAAPQGFASLLEWADVDYGLLGGDEVCCGYPLFISGLEDAAREMARANVAAVQRTGARQLITTCPSCYRAWREFYPELLGEDAGIEVLHASQWLAEADLPLQPLKGAERVTYHDPCDLGRASGVYDAPRQALAAVPGLELVEMANTRAETLCCGGGGNVESLAPDASRSVAQRRMAQASETGADLLVTACPQCERVLSAARSRENRLRVMDVVEVAWRALAQE
jgi:Fe-S oxidoreductase